jgi:hypothetical protein
MVLNQSKKRTHDFAGSLCSSWCLGCFVGVDIMEVNETARAFWPRHPEAWSVFDMYLQIARRDCISESTGFLWELSKVVHTVVVGYKLYSSRCNRPYRLKKGSFCSGKFRIVLLCSNWLPLCLNYASLV